MWEAIGLCSVESVELREWIPGPFVELGSLGLDRPSKGAASPRT